MTAAISALNIALFVFAGQALYAPVYPVLGEDKRKLVTCFGSTGGSSQEELIERNQFLADPALSWRGPHVEPGQAPGA